MAARRKNRGGRPTKLTDQVRGRICQAIAAGNYYGAACACAGVGYSTFRAWMAGKAPRFREFQEAVARAEAEAEVRAVALWQKQCPDDWRACRDFLARRHPDRWGPKQTFAGDPLRPVQVPHDHEADVAADLAGLEPAIREFLRSMQERDAAAPPPGADGAPAPGAPA
jgi:hypothetical protein